MAKLRRRSSSRGFSLIELLVALAFTMILMTGMASVFKSSLGTFYTSSENLASSRRNRLAVDLLGDDLNAAGMYMVSLAIPPSVSSSNPPFYVIPNVPIAGAAATDPQTTDELYFYMDVPLPFEGKLVQSTAGKDRQLLGASSGPMVVDCGEPTYAALVKQGQYMVVKDNWETLYLGTTPSVSDRTVTVSLAAQTTSGGEKLPGMTGVGYDGVGSAFQHLPGSGVIFFTPGQMVRYRIVMLALDPQNPSGTPCLVREQGTYSPNGFAATEPQQIITENVSGFKVYVSANAGNSWAGEGLAATGFESGWTNGIRAQLDTQISTLGRPEAVSTKGSEHWFREIPALVRVDVTTRSATQRTEYSSTPNALAYRNTKQSLVFVPRHFGLSMN